MSLKEKIMLVNLNISQWGARKLDRKVSREVNNTHNASYNAARVTKSLLSEDALKNIVKAANIARDYHIKYTLPWSDEGSRALPASNYFKYIGEMNILKQKFEDAVQDFLLDYPTMRYQTENFLGSMFNEQDYPETEDIRSKFKMRITVMPVADASDFRVKMADDDLKQMQESITNELNSRIQTATNSILDKARELVANLLELKDPNKKFHDTIITNILAFAETIPLLNFNNDQHVKDVTIFLQSLNYNPEDLRWKMKLRKEVVEKAQQIYNQI